MPAPGVQRLVSITCRGGNLLRLSAVLLVTHSTVIGIPVTVFIFFEHDAKILEVHHDLAVKQDLNIGLGPGAGCQSYFGDFHPIGETIGLRLYLSAATYLLRRTFQWLETAIAGVFVQAKIEHIELQQLTAASAIKEPAIT